MPVRKDWVKLSWYDRVRLKKFYQQRYHVEELAIMYKVPVWQVKELTKGLEQVERI